MNLGAEKEKENRGSLEVRKEVDTCQMTLILEWGDRVKQEGSLSAKYSGSFARGRGQEKWPSICDFMGLWADVVGVSAIV